MIQWIKRKWHEWWSYEECGKWFQGPTRWVGEPVSNAYCIRRHNHRGRHKEAR